MRACECVGAQACTHVHLHTPEATNGGNVQRQEFQRKHKRLCTTKGNVFFFLLSILFVSFFFKCLWSRFFYGKRQGLGVMQYADGSVYTGWWACSFYPWHETCFSLFFSSVFFASSWKTPSFPLFVFPATISICCLPLKINFLVFIGTKTTLGPGMGSYRAQTALP